MTRTLNARGLLDAWDAGAALPPDERSAMLLAAAWPDTTADTWMQQPLGVRDRSLLRLRAALFGPTLDTVAQCPSCDTRIEAQFRTTDIEAPCASAGVAEHEVGGRRVRFRLPSASDLQAAIASDDPKRALIVRCIDEPDALDAATLSAVLRRMSELDPQADVRIALACPACGETSEQGFDIAAYLWADVNDWALRTVADVHLLASRYGWREDDILSMSAFRRRVYLRMIES